MWVTLFEMLQVLSVQKGREEFQGAYNQEVRAGQERRTHYESSEMARVYTNVVLGQWVQLGLTSVFLSHK